MNNKQNVSQTLIFPVKLELSKVDFDVFMELKDILNHIGFIFEKASPSGIEIIGIHPVFNHNMIDNFLKS
ncbi:MAG: hypothetical protein CM15mP102_20600 [Flavobacteriales bacterium]|nr:MAG: hypothetical protein CM15mP102_20600 [Flavobacteriales bacterium]